MIEVFTWSAGGLALAATVFVFVLTTRRLVLRRTERIRREAEQRLRPFALALVHGEPVAGESFDERDTRVIAALLARYARSLAGDARGRIATFFERRGVVEEEIRALRSRRAWRRATAAYRLGDMASPTATPHLVAALDDPAREVRSAAARSLGRLAAPEAVEPLVYALAERRVPRAVGGQALLAIGPAALAALRELEQRTEADVRALAVELVGLLGDPYDSPLVVERLRDISAEVRAKAARALGRLGADEAAAALRATLDDRIPFVRVNAAAALGMIGDRDAVPALLSQAQSAHFDVARAAAAALARIDGDVVCAPAAEKGSSIHLREACDLLSVTR